MQNGAKMGAQIDPKIQKNLKKGMAKMMLKIDAEKRAREAPFGCHFDSPDGWRRGGRTSLRGWQGACVI